MTLLPVHPPAAPHGAPEAPARSSHVSERGPSDSATASSPGASAAPRLSRAALRAMGKEEARALSDELFRRLSRLERETHAFSETRAAIIELNLPLVRFAASRYRHRSEAREDIVQVGTVGLIKAVDAYDPFRGVEFPTFALPTISGEIKRFFRDTSWPVRVPRGMQERYLAVTRAADKLEQRLGRAPQPQEIAALLQLTTQEVTEGQEASRVYHARSLDALREDDSDDTGSAIVDRLGCDDGGLDMVEFQESVAPLLDGLPPREQTIVALRFWGNLTQSEIAEQVGISQMHVSRLLAGVLRRLRDELAPGDAADANGRAPAAN